MAGTARSHAEKPAARAAAEKSAAGPGGAAAMTARLPSPAVAAAILAGAERTERVHAKAPGRKPAAAHATPPAQSPEAQAPAGHARKGGSPSLTVVAKAGAASPVAQAPAGQATKKATALAMPAAAPGTKAAAAGAASTGGPAATALDAGAAAAQGSAIPASTGAARGGTAATGGATATGASSGAGGAPAGAGAAMADAATADSAAGSAGTGKAAAGAGAGASAEAGAKSGKPSAKDAGGAGPEGGAAAGAAAPTLELKMPEAPSGPSAATMKRIGGVQARAGGAAAAKAALPAADTQAGAARQAVNQPEAEAKAHAQSDLIAALGAAPAPSPEIIKLCERIRAVIRSKRPPDEDALMDAKPDAEAQNAGNQLNASVDGETRKVQGSYGGINNVPAAAAPAQGQALPGQPDAAATAPVNAKAATPDAVPAGKVSLDADAEASKKKVQDAGMETPAAQLVTSGPVAEARGAQGELDQAAKEDPAKILAGQKEALAKAEGNMAALQQQALSALTTARAATGKGAGAQQEGMVVSEEAKRNKASAEAQQVFGDAQKAVTALLQPVSQNALDKWEAAKTLLVTKFKADLAPVQERVNTRHKGASGFVVGLWDAVTGLPGWAEEGYKHAEESFADGVIDKLKEISAEVNAVIATCELLIKTARDRIAKIFADLGGGLADWAAKQQAEFDGKLDKLQEQAISTRDNFNKDLMDNAKEAVDEVRAEIAELRKKAGGLLGRIANAIGRFLDDPVKFIIEGLLELLGIPPAAFWAVIAKIKKVVKEIADDPMKFANNLLKGLAEGFGKFFDNFGTHLLKGFLSWLLGGLKDVQIPKDVSVRSIVTFFLQIMGITWPNIRKILVKLVGAKNVALIEKVYSLVSLLIEKGPEGIYEMIKEKLDPQAIVDQVVSMAVDYMVSAIIKQVAARIIMLFNPAGAIVQALEAIYRVLKWIFQNAARIFTLVETVVNGIADVLAGNTGGFATAVEKALGMLIAPVISFIADYLSLGDLPAIVAEKVKSMREWILGMIEKALAWMIEKGKALLAAMGIGKKDKDKDKKKGDGEVGEELGWTAAGESHHLWIKAESAHYVPMMASEQPHPVEDALRNYSKAAKELKETDEEQAALAEAAIAQGHKALATLAGALATVANVKATPDAPPDHLTQANAAVVAAEQPLRDAVSDAQEHLGLNDDERVKATKAYYKSSPFSTAYDLAPRLKLVPRSAQRIVAKWFQKGIVFRIQSSSRDPEGMCTFDPVVAKWRETNPNNRQKYGYVNPKKTSAVGLEVLSKGLLGAQVAGGSFKRATGAQQRDAGYHQKQAHYASVLPGSPHDDFMFDDAILGHKEPGASGNWNDEGHKRDRNGNLAWNQKAENYHGPEHWEESSASGGSAERYNLPTKEDGSHESWLQP